MNRIRMFVFITVFGGFVTYCYALVDPTASISFNDKSPTAGGDGA